MLGHEYSVIGHSRSNVGRYLAIVAGGVASAVYLLVAAIIQLLKDGGFEWFTGVIFWPVTAGVIYAGVHAFFDKVFWKTRCGYRLFKIANIEGQWVCEGQTMDSDGNVTYPWIGTVTITQSWEKITVKMATDDSQSSSVIAALINEDAHGHRLMWRYINEPKAGGELKGHVGFADITFNSKLSEAEGDYFNNKGRWTFGRMKLRRQENNDH